MKDSRKQDLYYNVVIARELEKDPMKELSNVQIVLRRHGGKRKSLAHIGYAFDCAWDGGVWNAEEDFDEAQSGSPNVNWIMCQAGNLWTASIGGPNFMEVERFRTYLVQRKGWMEKLPKREAG